MRLSDSVIMFSFPVQATLSLWIRTMIQLITSLLSRQVYVFSNSHNAVWNSPLITTPIQ